MKKEKGFSLVQVLVAGALMSALALVLAKLGQNQAKIQRTAYDGLDINHFYQNLQSHLLDSDSCTNTLKAATGLSTYPKEVDIHEIKDKNNKTIYNKTDKNPSPSLKIKKLTVKRKDSHNTELEVMIEKKVKGRSFGGDTLSRRVQLTADYDSTGSIMRCYSQMDNAVKSACAALGGELDGSKCVNTRMECEFKVEMLKLKARENPGRHSVCGEDFHFKKMKWRQYESKNFKLPSSYIPRTLSIHLLGGGGGGGASLLSKGGQGGDSGDIAIINAEETKSLRPGDIIKVTIGKGGRGWNPSYASSTYKGEDGYPTMVTIKGVIYQAKGGRGGVSNVHMDGNGVGVEFMGTHYKRGEFRFHHHGKPGERGAGGSGGHIKKITTTNIVQMANAGIAKEGGNGGDGLVGFIYMIDQDLNVML